jgi:hypothetical protein
MAKEWVDLEKTRICKSNIVEIKELVEKYKKLKINESGVSNIEHFLWNEHRELWNTATKRKRPGILKVRESKIYEIWRTTVDLPNYICLIDNRPLVRTICQGIEKFSINSGKSLAYHIQAGPGTGKTYLARTLAKHYKLGFLSFNISQLISKSDLIDCFDEISTRQANDREAIILAYFDEINALIERDYAYAAFLTVLDEGIYVRGGRKFHIRPCIWLFTGTPDEESYKPSDKFDDFRSRLSSDILELKTPECENDILRFLISYLHKNFIDISGVSEDAVDFLSERVEELLKGKNGKRKGSLRDAVKELDKIVKGLNKGVLSTNNIRGKEGNPDNSPIVMIV